MIEAMVTYFPFLIRTIHAFFTVAMPLNCPGMYRGLIREDGIPKTAIFADDVLD